MENHELIFFSAGLITYVFVNVSNTCAKFAKYSRRIFKRMVQDDLLLLLDFVNALLIVPLFYPLDMTVPVPTCRMCYTCGIRERIDR